MPDKPLRAVAGKSVVCVDCRCRWKVHPDGSMQLYDAQQKPCAACDNIPRRGEAQYVDEQPDMEREPALVPRVFSIDELRVDPANVRMHSERSYQAIAASLKKFGQRTPIVVDADGVVIKGNGTLEGARRLNWRTIEALVLSLRGKDARAYALADNRTSDLSRFDARGLAVALDSLADPDLVLAAGFDADELADVMLDAAPPEPPAEFAAVDGAVQHAYTCPKCSYQWTGAKSPAKR